MREYVVLTISENTIVFNFRIITKEEKEFLNSNSFNKDSLFYDLKYFKKKIANITELIAKSYNINVLRINRLITFKYVIDIINKLNIDTLVLNFLSTIDLEDYELFLNCNSLKTIYCYFMASDIKSRFNQKNISIITTSTRKITDKFMEAQDLKNKDSVYYRKVIKITEDYPELIDDLREFLKINYKLRAIHIYAYSKDMISSIAGLVKNDESRNVIIYLHQESDKGDFIVNNFSWLKELSDRCKKEYTCEFRILYANRFLSKNLFKQLTFNNLKLISILCMYVSIVAIVLIKSYDYIEKISVDELNNQLLNNISNSELSNQEETENENLEIPVENTEEVPDEVVNPKPQKNEVKTKYDLENSFKALKKINNETVGYLVVKNTNISYPLVRHSDNSYYLSRDFYKKKAAVGWVYLDYRNDLENLNDNSIIYGHNNLNDTMFGTLSNVLSSSWRKNEDNLIIDLDSETHKYKFKIFAAYKVDYTTDYMVTKFDSKKEKTNFINMIRNRSLFKTKDKVNENSKILTLSTCTGNNRRLVVHAVLVEEEKQ